MMSNNDWVQEGTPRDADWPVEDDYGVPLEPAEWDDYSAEQAVPVPPPAPERTDADGADVPTAPDPDDVVADEPTLGDERGLSSEPTLGHEDRAHDELAADGHQPAVEEDWHRDEVVAEDRAPEPHDTEQGDLTHDAPAAESRDSSWESWDEAEQQPLAEDADILATDPALHNPADVATVETHDVDLDDDATRVHPRDDFGFGRPVQDPAAGDVAADTDPTTYNDPEATALHSPAFDDADHQSTDYVAPVAPAPTGDGGAAGLGAGVAGATGAAAMAGLYRNDHDAQHTQVIDTSERLAAEQAEEERLARQLRDDKVARDQRLGMVATSDANAVREAPLPRPGVGPFGSFGLFILRVISGAILGVIAYQILGNIDRTATFIGQTVIPEPRLVSWILGFTLAAMALFLIIGFAVRVVGLLLAVIAGCSLAFIRWGQFSPFVDGMEGFIGDKDLLFAGVGLLFFTLGGGRAGIDGAFSAARYNARISKNS